MRVRILVLVFVSIIAINAGVRGQSLPSDSGGVDQRISRLEAEIRQLHRDEQAHFERLPR